MTKEEALALFDGRVAPLAEALGVVRQTVYNWPDGELERGWPDRVIGAAVRAGRMSSQEAAAWLRAEAAA